MCRIPGDFLDSIGGSITGIYCGAGGCRARRARRSSYTPYIDEIDSTVFVQYM